MKYYMAKKRFGSIEAREKIIERDSFQCTSCHISRNDHRKKYNCDLTVDHIDGNGRFSENPNNKDENLITLCKKCHGSKDGKRADYSTRRSYKGENHPMAKITNIQRLEILSLRKDNITLKEISMKYNISISHVSTICKELRG